jgi:glycosyltransferase involved in cell wall biosynthesis
VGRLEPIKNYELALRAFARLKPSSLPWRPLLILAGDGSEGPTLRALATELGIDDSVRFLGWHDDAEHLYQAFDLFTLTSRAEGTSISLLEAMSSELCCVVTDVGGNAAVLGPELRDNLVPANDPEALANRWTEFLSSPDRRRTSGKLSRERVIAHFSVLGTVHEYAALYENLVQKPNSSNRGR